MVHTGNSDLFEIMAVAHLPITPASMLILSTLLAALRSVFRSHAAVEMENLALRHQISVLQRSAKKRSKLTPADRLLWVVLSRIWAEWRSALAIVQPETVIAWHRKGFRWFWTWKVRRGHVGRADGFPRGSGFDPPDESGESIVGRSSHPR